MVGQSQKNSEKQIALKSTKDRHYRKGLKSEPYEEDGYAE